MKKKNLFEKPVNTSSLTVNIPVDKILPRKFRIRNTGGSFTELAKSISMFGMISPLVVRKTSEGFELVCGERRLKAAGLAGLACVPCTIVEFSDSMAAAAALMDNFQRQELHFFEKAEGLELLGSKFFLSDHQIAVMLGLPLFRIKDMQKFLEFTNEQKKSIISGEFTKAHAEILLSSDMSLRDELIQKTSENKLSPKQLDEYISEKIKADEQKKSYRRRARALSDLHLFFNTIERAVKILRLAGVDVRTEKTMSNGFTEYLIRVPSSKNQ